MVSTQMKPNLIFDEIYISQSTLPIFIKLHHDLVLMQAVEVPSFWWGFKVVHFRFWCIFGSVTLRDMENLKTWTLDSGVVT
jgi:hypothetical protein